LKANDIKDFTVSYRFCEMIDRLTDFEKFNCKMSGLTQVKTGWKLTDGSQETIPALKMRL